MTVTSTDDALCWVLLAPMSVTEAESVVALEWTREFPHAVDPAPWEVRAGRDAAIIVGRSPGTEGVADRLASLCSRKVPQRRVLALWLEADRERVQEWRGGSLITTRHVDPRCVAAASGLVLPARRAPRRPPSVAVVAGSTPLAVAEELRVLGARVRVQAIAGGVLVADDAGPLGTQAWDLATALPDATVYYVQQSAAPDSFMVLVLRGTRTLGRFREPAQEDDETVLLEILGATTRAEILHRLGIPKHRLRRT